MTGVFCLFNDGGVRKLSAKMFGFEMGAGARQFLRFTSAGGDRLVRLEDVVECLPMVRIESDDGGSDPRYRGLLHYRGSVVPVFDPEPTSDPGLQPQWFLIVVEQAGHRLALVAHDVDDIETCAADNCQRLKVGADQKVTVVSIKDEVVRVVEPSQIPEPV